MTSRLDSGRKWSMISCTVVLGEPRTPSAPARAPSTVVGSLSVPIGNQCTPSKLWTLRRRVSDRDPGFPHSRRSEQRQQPGVVAFNELGNRLEFRIPADRVVGENWKRWDGWLMEVG